MVVRTGVYLSFGGLQLALGLGCVLGTSLALSPCCPGVWESQTLCSSSDCWFRWSLYALTEVKYFRYQAVSWVGESGKGLDKTGRRRYGQTRVQLPLLFGRSVTLPSPGRFSGTAVFFFFFLGFPVSTAEYAIPQPHNSNDTRVT